MVKSRKRFITVGFCKGSGEACGGVKEGGIGAFFADCANGRSYSADKDKANIFAKSLRDQCSHNAMRARLATTSPRPPIHLCSWRSRFCIAGFVAVVWRILVRGKGGGRAIVCRSEWPGSRFSVVVPVVECMLVRGKGER